MLFFPTVCIIIYRAAVLIDNVAINTETVENKIDNIHKQAKRLKDNRKLKLNIFTFLPLVAKPVDQRTKYLQNRCSFMRGICTKKIGAISQLGAEKITCPPKRG